MEDLTELLSTNFSVTKTHNNVNAEHPRFSQYKQKFCKNSQEERRRKQLELQKKKRFDFANFSRRLADGELSDEENNDEDMEWLELDKPRVRAYKDQLMYSEWLVDIPDDFKDMYYLVLCPVGTRCLIIASRGNTTMYRKNGRIGKTFASRLPGGNRNEYIVQKGGYTILDCVYSEIKKTFYILDVMCWNGHPVYDSDTEFRLYWLECKLSEDAGATEKTNLNRYIFERLPYYPCTEDSLVTVMNSPLPFTAELDGLLFYHKQTHYTPGATPLVGWLKAFMVPEMLGISISSAHQQSAPSHYSGVKNHIQEYEEERKQLREKRSNKNTKMDVTESDKRE